MSITNNIVRFYRIAILAAFVAASFGFVSSASAVGVGVACNPQANPAVNCDANLNCVGGVCVAAAGGAAVAEDPFGVDKFEDTLKLGKRDIRQTAAEIINVSLGLLGIIAVVIILIGGFQWMTAGGNEDKVGEARKRIFAGIIGLAIILSAWAVARFVLLQLGKATNTRDIQNLEN